MKKKIAINRSKKGFTLIELMISMVIFVIFLGTVTNTYVSIVHAQKQANEVRKIYSDVRDFVTSLNEEIRLSAIDYDCYEGKIDFIGGVLNTCEPGITLSQGRSNYLSLIKKDGLEKSLFFYYPDEKMIYLKKWLKADAGWIVAPGFEDGFLPVLSDAVTIKNFSFSIYPVKNPYSDDSSIYANNALQFQPKVTIFMSAISSNKALGDFHLDFQTTISSRVYSRVL